MSANALRSLALRPAPRIRAWIVLVSAAVLAAGILAWGQSRIDARIQARLQLQRRAVSPVSPPPRDRLPPMSKTGLDRLSAEMLLLNRDWNALLAGIVPQEPQTRLLSLDVNPMNGAVHIAGQAATHEAVTAYTVALERSETLREVRLIRLDGQAQGVLFEVTARWP